MNIEQPQLLRVQQALLRDANSQNKKVQQEEGAQKKQKNHQKGAEG